ncbi:flippase [Fusobacterium ulcerans]|uniref:Stage V sporulation protein B n=1 Tax=Fusobacterium ulcerans TaxID=861 RepID=A0AAX2JDQ0_9FUSO|nr:flippase [Fusobacterium ulcerans]AVQ27309.1 flippase [Fusobacterium ulcerans]EFS24562.1 hypothetical protein FUAG_00077 [Fusobacterium ulcerans ATCC 49185]SQJ12397.1 stage V sporulation protein B [Fusobacterium ulcerans]
MKSKLLENYVYNVGIVFTSILFPVLFFPYSSRILTPVYYGKYTFALSIISYFVTIANLGIPIYGIRELSRSKVNGENQFKKNFTEIIIISIISSFISSIIFFITIIYFDKLKKEYVLFLILGMSIIFSFSTLDYFFITIENHKRRTIRLLIVRIISMIFLFSLVKKPEDYLKFALIMALPEIIAKIIDFISVRKYLLFDIKNLTLKKHIKPLIVIFFYVISTNIYLNIDSTMIGIMKGDKEVGYYNVAVKMTKIIIPLITSLGLVLAPRMIEKIKNKEKESLIKDMDLYLNFIFFISIPTVCVLFILSNNIVLIFSGKKYLESILPMQIMLPIIIFIPISGFSAGQILIPYDKESIVFKVSLIGLGSNFLLNFLLIPKYGILGAGTATLITEFLVCIFRFYKVKKIFKEYNMFTKERSIYIITSLLSFIICIFLKYFSKILDIYLEFLFILVVFGVIYMSVLLMFREYFISLGVKKIKILLTRRN